MVPQFVIVALVTEFLQMIKKYVNAKQDISKKAINVKNVEMDANNANHKLSVRAVLTRHIKLETVHANALSAILLPILIIILFANSVMQTAESVKDPLQTVLNAKMDSPQFPINAFALEVIIQPLTSSNAYHVELDALLALLELNVISANQDIHLLIHHVFLIVQLAPLMLEINAKNVQISAATAPAQ